MASPKKAGGAGKTARPSTARPALSQEFVAQHKRRRIMDALVELTAEQGYEATKISDIVQRAGVARKTLYDNFEGKEQVFLAAFDAAHDELLSRIEVTCAEAEGGLRERIEAGLGAFLGYIAEEPALAWMCMVESLTAAPAAAKRYEDALQGFVTLTRHALPQDSRLPGTLSETLVGRAAWIVYRQIRCGEAEQAEDLLPQLTEFMIAPYVGAGLRD